jgi:hypothetical protein
MRSYAMLPLCSFERLQVNIAESELQTVGVTDLFGHDEFSRLVDGWFVVL